MKRNKTDEMLIKQYKVDKGYGLPTDCIYFNWSKKVKETCSFFSSNCENYTHCIKLDGLNCENCKNGIS